MSITATEMNQRSMESRRKQREVVAKEARKMYDDRYPVQTIAEVLGKKYKKNGKPFSIFTIYDYLGGVRKNKEKA